MQKTVSHIKSSTAPHFQREAVSQNLSCARSSQQHIAGTHSGSQQRLVGITHSSIADEQLLLVDCIWTFFIQQLF